MSGVQAGKWPRIALGEIAVKRRGSVDPQKFPDETFELYSIPAYDAGRPEIVEGADIGSSKQLLEPDDVVISRIVPHIQRVWIVGPKTAYRQIGSGEWIAYRSKRLLPQYLRHALLSPSFHASFMSTVAGVGGSLLRARPSAVAEIEISCPPLDEQRRIAAILDKADAIRRKRQQALALADDFLRSAFLEMFGDPVANPHGWICYPIETIVASVDAGWSAKGLDRPACSDELGVLKISAVTSGRYRPAENKAVETIEAGRPLVTPQKGDLLFSRANTRELVAATCIVDRTIENVFLPDKLWRIRLKPQRATPEYLKFVLSDPTFRAGLCSKATGTSGSMLNISQGKLLETALPLPPIDQQRAFSRLFWRVEGTRAQLVEQSENDSILFASLSQRAFRGEL